MIGLQNTAGEGAESSTTVLLTCLAVGTKSYQNNYLSLQSPATFASTTIRAVQY